MTALLCRTRKHRVESTFEPHDNLMGRATFGVRIPLSEMHRGRRYTHANLYFAGIVSVTPTVTGGAVAGVEVVIGKRPRARYR